MVKIWPYRASCMREPACKICTLPIGCDPYLAMPEIHVYRFSNADIPREKSIMREVIQINHNLSPEAANLIMLSKLREQQERIKSKIEEIEEQLHERQDATDLRVENASKE